MHHLPLNGGSVVPIANFGQQRRLGRLPSLIRWFSQARISTVLLLTLFFASLSNPAMGAIVNRTIDDTKGDPITGFKPIYFPATNVWQDATCKGCAIQPDPTLAFDGTWTGATYQPEVFKSMSIELHFSGVAVYVFFILANFEGIGITTQTQCRFLLDGVPAGTFQHVPTLDTALQYNALAFQNQGMTNSTHNLTIVTDGATDHLFLNFDYAIYSVEVADTVTTSSSSSPPTIAPSASNKPTSASSSASASASQTNTSPASLNGDSKKSTVGAVAGGVGALLAVAAAILLFRMFFLRRSRNKRLSKFSTHEDQFVPQTVTPFSSGGPPGAGAGYNRQFPGYGSASPMSYGQPQQSGGLTASSAYGALGGAAMMSDRRTLDQGYPMQPRQMSSYYEGDRSTYHESNPYGYAPSALRPGSAGTGQHPSTLPYLGSDVDAQSAYGGYLPNPHPEESAYDGVSPSEAFGATLQSSGFGLGAATASQAGDSAPSQSARSTSSRPILAVANPTTEELRDTRQEELHRQMETIQNELNGMKELQRRKSTAKGPPPDVSEVDELKQQIDFMRQQIGVLQGQQQSPWAQGLSDEPPPGYTPAHSH